MTTKSDNLFVNCDNVVDDFVLVWLDACISKATINKDEQAEAAKRQSQLQTIINFTRTFNDEQDCCQFIESSTTEKVFLIVCGSLGESIVPTVHSLPQVTVIYIFCMDQLKHTVWTKSYDKVRAICTTTNELLSVLVRDVSMYAKNLTPLSIFTADMSREVSLCSLNVDEKRFMWFYLLLQALLRMPADENARCDMQNECRRAYQGNVIELANIDKFFQNYTPDNCIRWYTKDSFIYRLLNKAFRTENIDIIFKFRFFVVDLYCKLKELHRPFTGTLWRGQTMSIAELQILKDSKGKMFSVNTFFSTTHVFNYAVSFSGEGKGLPHLASVLFQIDVDEHIDDTQPFANISALSNMPEENEVLFAMNTIFHLNDVEQYGDIWVAHLSLASGGEQTLKDLVNHFKKEINEEKIPPLLILGELFWKMGDNGRADRYYRIMLKELPPNHEIVGKIWNNIGVIAMENGNFDQARDYFDKALSLQEPTETLDLAETYMNIASLHDKNDEIELSIKFNEKSLKILLRLLPHDHALIAVNYNNIGLVYFHRHDYENALYYYEKTRLIESTALGTSDHFYHATTLNNIGLVHFEQGHYELALNFYKEALAIRERSLLAQHLAFAESYNNIGSVQEQIGKLNEALSMFERALEVHLAAQLPEHPDIANAYNNLANVLGTLGRSKDALANYFKALKYTGNTYPGAMRSRALYLHNIGEQYRYEGNLVRAAKYHQKSFKIRLQLFLKTKDPDLAMSYRSLGCLFYHLFRFGKALYYLFQAFKIYRKFYERNHPIIALLLFKIGLVYSRMKRYTTSLNYMKQVFRIQLGVLPNGHRDIIKTLQAIKFLKKILRYRSKRNKKWIRNSSHDNEDF